MSQPSLFLPFFTDRSLASSTIPSTSPLRSFSLLLVFLSLSGFCGSTVGGGVWSLGVDGVVSVELSGETTRTSVSLGVPYSFSTRLFLYIRSALGFYSGGGGGLVVLAVFFSLLQMVKSGLGLTFPKVVLRRFVLCMKWSRCGIPLRLPSR